MNFLEQLVAEWYAYRGFNVRSNVMFGRRARGGWEGEIDVLAFDSKEKILEHVETSGDAGSWDQRRERFRRKFQTAEKHYEEVVDWEFQKVRKVVVVSMTQPKNVPDFGNGIQVMTIPKLMTQIEDRLKKVAPAKAAVPESYPLLRAVQFAVWFRAKHGNLGRKAGETVRE